MTAASSSPLLAELDRRRRAGTLQPDAAQDQVAHALAGLLDRLSVDGATAPPSASGGGGLLSRLGLGRPAAPAPAVRGLYVWGPVGRGKSMLMDMFFDLAPVAQKRRVHFHDFMLEVHAGLHRRRQALKEKGAPAEVDPVPPYARTIAKDVRLLCFDEFQVTNIADAMILARLFGTLFEDRVVVVATSNRPPDELYKNGLQRDRFLPFIALLQQRLDVVTLAGPRDWRLDRLRELAVYVSPDGAMARTKLDEAWSRLTSGDAGRRVELDVGGRTLVVPRASGGVARFAFPDLCAKALGAADYIALAEAFHTVILDGIPRLSPERRNEAVRFTTLIDALYEHKVKLICSAAAMPFALYPEGDFSFEFERTASRLMEMQSHDYLALPHAA